ncbi:hypothetical protein CAEBREN_00409 [Caenorhabditis brenneri]|uniref:RING-type domain-containing protein n=1 Tax=Caenorhabditis brenneri TaxID=135651 RepID=G0P5H4_CAEBE|nr:hypothetical protein CAEBREN_00409 [Caenorhabditis brenneri]
MSAQEPSTSQTMERQVAVSLIENLCQCQICCSNYNETTKVAQMLHCGHTFCMDCIRNIQKYGNSAHLECPSCRSETKCDIDAVPTNFLVMEIMQKLQIMGPAEVAPVKAPKLARDAQRERTIDELVDEKYRALIADVKAELMAKFEALRESLGKSALHAVHSELDCLTDNVMDAVRDAYDGMSDSELETQEDEDETEGDDGNMTTLSTANSDLSDGHNANESTFVVTNTLHKNDSECDSTEDSEEEGSSSEYDDSESNDGCSEMSEVTTEGETPLN